MENSSNIVKVVKTWYAHQLKKKMPFKGETWIKTQTGWRTMTTIVIVNREIRVPTVASPYSSDSEDESSRSQNVCGIYWECGPPFVILPGESRKTSYMLSRNDTSSEQNATSPPVVSIFSKLAFKQSIKNPRRFNYVTKMLDIVLKQDLITKSGSSQKKLLNLFEQLVNTVLFTELNIDVAKKLTKTYKDRHLANKNSFCKNNQKLWSHVLNKISEMERKMDKFQVKKLCRGSTTSHIHFLDLPVEALRLILRCFSDHKDIASIALVNRYLYKLTIEAGLWKSMCLYHLPASKLTAVDPNIPSSWKNVYRKTIKRSSMRQSFAEMLIICSHCHFVFWKGTHLCSYDPRTADMKVPVPIPITPKGFCHLFER